MNLDDRLDALLGASGQPVPTLLADADADADADGDVRALTPLLSAAGRLAPLRDAQPSARFADHLERDLLALAAGRVSHSPRPATAESPSDGDAPTLPLLVPYGAADGNGRAHHGEAPPWRLSIRTDGAAHGRQTRRARQRAALPIWARALAAACVLLALGSSLFAAAANAQPGSPLFGLHQAEQWAQVSLASPDDRARLHLQYAGDALAALDRAVARHTGDPDYADALATLQSELGATATAIAALPAGQTHDTLAAQLAALQQRARNDLRAALPGLGWNDRLATTTVLGGLGETVPHVTSAAIHQIAGHDANAQGAGHGSHAVQVVVSGDGFMAGARLAINGQPAGTVLSVSDGMLIAQVSFDPSADGHVLSIGIENPDGTAAQTSAVDHGAAVTPTPAPTATPTPHHGHGGHP